MKTEPAYESRYLAYMALAAILVLVLFTYRHGGLQGGRGNALNGAEKPFPGFPVDINSAGVDSLVLLPGVGRKTAEAIISERERGGGFAELRDIQKVRGIGARKFKALRDFIIIKKRGSVKDAG
ncbi:MAG: ComEA family DNA-binding protein [Thermodesulfobacteriota bacterium]